MELISDSDVNRSARPGESGHVRPTHRYSHSHRTSFVQKLSVMAESASESFNNVAARSTIEAQRHISAVEVNLVISFTTRTYFPEGYPRELIVFIMQFYHSLRKIRLLLGTGTLLLAALTPRRFLQCRCRHSGPVTLYHRPRIQCVGFPALQ